MKFEQAEEINKNKKESHNKSGKAAWAGEAAQWLNLHDADDDINITEPIAASWKYTSGISILLFTAWKTPLTAIWVLNKWIIVILINS